MSKEIKKEILQNQLDEGITVNLTLHDFLELANGKDESEDPLSVGSVYIGKIKNGLSETINNYELPGAVYQILVRDRFIQLNIDFERSCRPTYAILKRALQKYDELLSTEADIDEALYGFNMVVFPLALYGRLSFVLINPVMWVNGEHPENKKIQRVVILFEKDNCQFVSNEEINIVGVRADIEREIKQQYEMEEEAFLRLEDEQKNVQKDAEKEAANEMLMDLSGLNDQDFEQKMENQYQGRIRFTSDDRDVLDNDFNE